MARKKRIWYPGAMYHVMSRGNRRTEIFRDASDHLRFLECMQIIKEKHPFHIHALCLMTNHFHIAVETKEIELWRIMQKILSLYAEEFNHKYNFTGHVFEGRYTACLIENERYFLEVSRYIHLNPVKAQMVRAPQEYDYSSYGLFVPRGKKPGKADQIISKLVNTSRVLEYFGNDPNEQYRMFVESRIAHTEQEQMIQKEMKEDDMWLPA